MKILVPKQSSPSSIFVEMIGCTSKFVDSFMAWFNAFYGSPLKNDVVADESNRFILRPRLKNEQMIINKIHYMPGRIFRRVILICLWAGHLSCNRSNVDFIIRNAHIYTVDSNFSQKTTLVIHQGKVLVCGGEELLNEYQADSVWDANGMFIYPGFIDAHCHFSGYAMSKEQISLEGCVSVRSILSRLEKRKNSGKLLWLQARMWDDTKMTNGEVLDRQLLDEKFPDFPVCIMRVDGHSILCNTNALLKAGFNNETIVAGRKLEQINGKLSGWLRDEAMQQLLQLIPEVNEEMAVQYLQETEEEFFGQGVTSFTDCMVENAWMHHLMKAYSDKNIHIHGHYVLTCSEQNLKEFLTKGKIVGEDYSICGFKVFADGTLGSKSAAMLENYDSENHRGHLIVSQDSLKRLAEQIYSSNFQLMVHAIGDSTNRMVCRVMADLLKTRNDRRWRIEHAQVVKEEDLHLFNQYSIIPSVQPTHAMSDMRWLYDRIGRKRAHMAYAYKDLLKQNGWLPLGTDFPVEALNPLRTFCTAVYRKNELNEPTTGFQLENALSREEAIRGMTIWAATSVFDEKNRGSLEPGKEADFVVLPIDLIKADVNTIYKAKAARTYQKGKRVY